MNELRKPAASPQEVRNTIEWLIQNEDYAQARSLAFTLSRYLPQEHPETSDFLAMVLHRTKHYAEAAKWAAETVRLVPGSSEARYNFARCLHSAGDSVQAEQEILKVLSENPSWVDPGLDLAMYVCAQGRFEEAKSLLLKMQNALPANDPQQAIVTFNLSWHLLREGTFKEGIKALSVGRKLRVFGSYAGSYAKPKIFKGLPVAGKKVLLVGEAGAGDEIITVRFAKMLADQGANVIWETGQNMQSVFLRVPGVSKVVSHQEALSEPYDYWAPSMDLAAILEVSEEDLPRSQYIFPSESSVTSWKSKIAQNGKLKVGLRWQGNPLYEQDLFRSVPFSLFRQFILSNDADFYSLQRDTGVDELLSEDNVTDLSSELKTWEDTVAAISLLDVVVTSCTSIAHLAGALGKKTLLFTPMISYYVWTSPGDKSIWYDDVELYRQKNFHDWSVEAQQIGKKIAMLASQIANPPTKGSTK